MAAVSARTGVKRLPDSASFSTSAPAANTRAFRSALPVLPATSISFWKVAVS